MQGSLRHASRLWSKGWGYRAGFDNLTTFHRDLANFPRKSPSQSGYCSTNDGREGQDNSEDGGTLPGIPLKVSDSRLS